MSVYGGIEYTEHPTTELLSYPGVASVGAPIAPVHTIQIGGAQIGFFHVLPATMNALVGGQRATDHEMFRDGRVRLTNDTISAEWVIEGHTIHGLTADTMMQNIKTDITKVLYLRHQLRQTVQGLITQHGQNIVIAPGAADLRAPGAQGVFRYKPSVTDSGSAQITVQYVNRETILRICKMNAARYLPGTKIAPGDDVDIVAGDAGLLQRVQYHNSSFDKAQTLLDGLTAIATPVTVAHVTHLTQQQVGLIMLMVVNDALASTMRRHAANIGQAADKNAQRFYPKSERQFYVNAVANAAIPAPALAALRVQLHNSAPAMSQLFWDSCDPLALDTGVAVLGLSQDAAAIIAEAKILASTGKRDQVSNTQLLRTKNAVLGVNGAGLDARIRQAALAYTDATGNATDHYNGGNGNVILSINFTPVAGGVHGAVYELRDNEVPMGMGETKLVMDTMTKLLTASL